MSLVDHPPLVWLLCNCKYVGETLMTILFIAHFLVVKLKSQYTHCAAILVLVELSDYVQINHNRMETKQHCELQ